MRYVDNAQQAVAAGKECEWAMHLHAAWSSLAQETRASGQPFRPEWEGLFDALRIKTSRENAEFLASGLVKKLFQVSDSPH